MTRPDLGLPPAKRLLEASRFLTRQGDVYDAVRRLAQRLHEEGLDYAVVGGMAVVEHGSRRTTEDMNLLMRKETLEEFRDRYLGRGYVPAFPGATSAFRDTETGVRIEVVVTGDYPGDGKPKDVAFPDPADVAGSGDEFRVVRLETLIDLKLASGMSAPHRLRDLADVQDLIVRTRLPLEFVERLHSSVRAEYRRLWDPVRDVPRDDDYR
jgi:hypothetical protein